VRDELPAYLVQHLGDPDAVLVLDDDSLFQAVKADLIQLFPQTPSNGFPLTPVEVILRMLVVKHLYGWSCEATERWVSDSLILL